MEDFLLTLYYIFIIYSQVLHFTHMEKLTARANEVAHILKLIAHPKRLLLCCRLLTGPKSVGELEKDCTISQSQLSQFLGKLEKEGLLVSEKK